MYRILSLIYLFTIGKTTLATLITLQLNAHAAQISNATDPPALMIPMDGYHHPRATLSQMSNPKEAHARRGAAFTFDAVGWAELVAKLRAPISDSIRDHGRITAPSFDHAVKDPVSDDIVAEPWHRIVVFEGNYVALNVEPWASAARMMDEVWFVHVDEDTARDRLAKRHVRAGIVKNEEEGRRRADENDLVNGRQITSGTVDGVVTEILESVEDHKWTTA
jgi:pantothenate kinase